MFRRFAALILAAVLCLSGCARTEAPADSAGNPTEETTEKVTVGSRKVNAYVEQEASALAEKILAHRSEETFSFAWLSDLHAGYAYEHLDWKADESSLKDAGEALFVLTETVPLELIVLGGDLANGGPNSTKEDTLRELETAVEAMQPAVFFTPTLYLVGNHEDAPYRETGERVSTEELFRYFGRKNQITGAVSNEADPSCNYGYLEFPLQKMRIIYLDTNDKTGWPSTGWKEGDSGSAYMDACNVSARQLQWLADVALDFSDKEQPADWGFFVLSHVPLDTGKGKQIYRDETTGESFEYNTDHVIQLLTDYLTGKEGSFTLNGETASYDFSGLTEKANLYACVNGHKHSFDYTTYGEMEIPAISCPNVRDGRERESGDGKTYTKTPGTGESTSFCVITLNRTTRTLYADTYGAGPDRQWKLPKMEQIEYTDLVARAVDTEENIFDGTGYRNDVRLSALNDLPEMPGYVTTGIVRWRKEPGDFSGLKPIYIRGVDLDRAEKYVRIALVAWSEEEGYGIHKMVKGGNPSMWDTFFEVELLAEQYYRLTPKEDALNSWEQVCHFILCAKGRGENLKITVGEPVE